MVAMWADQAEQEANGFWLSKRSSHMPDRYHGQRVQRSLIVKQTNKELLDRARRGDKPLSWQFWGVALASLNVQAAREAANATEAEAHLEVSVPQTWTSVPPLPASFAGAPRVCPKPEVDPQASSVHSSTDRAEESEADTASSSDSSAPGSVAEDKDEQPVASSPSRNRFLELEVLLEAHKWQATKYRGALHVHLIQEESEVPRCRKKRGLDRVQSLARINACGDSVAELSSFGATSVSFCAACLSNARVQETELRSWISRQVS